MNVPGSEVRSGVLVQTGESRRLANGKFLAFAMWIFLAWSVYVAWLYPQVQTWAWSVRIVVHEAIRFGVFVGPLFLLHGTWKPWRALGVFVPGRRELRYGVLGSAVWCLICIGVAIGVQGKTNFQSPSWEFWLTGFTTATIVEEIAFRGYFVRQWMGHGRWIAIITSSMLFVLIHYPGWIMLGMLPGWEAYMTSSLSIFLLGVVLGWICLKTGSIWPGVIVHACNNLVAVMLA